MNSLFTPSCREIGIENKSLKDLENKLNNEKLKSRRYLSSLIKKTEMIDILKDKLELIRTFESSNSKKDVILQTYREEITRLMNELILEEDENKEESTVILKCSICFNIKQLTVMLPCYHVYSCKQCADNITRSGFNKCSICNKRISSYHEIFICSDK